MSMKDWCEGNRAASEELAKVKKQRDELLEACENIENDDGSIPPTIWGMVQSAIAKAKGE